MCEQKRISNILLNNRYMILEFEDGTFIPARLLDDIFHTNTHACQLCGGINNLISLDNCKFICRECIEALCQQLLDNGASMNLQLDKFLNRDTSK